MHHEPYFADPSGSPLPVTEDLAERLIGIPCFAHISSTAVARIMPILQDAAGIAARKQS